MRKKYELTEETMTLINGTVLHCIKALVDIDICGRKVKAGDLGGWIEKESNLSNEGNCWVFDEAKVFGNAKIYDDAVVFGNAQVFGNARVYGDAQVYGDVRVYGDAWVYDNAMVYGNVMVYNNAKVYGHAYIHGTATIKNNEVKPQKSTNISYDILEKALKIIREECQSHDKCNECPLRAYNDTDCSIVEINNPSCWELKSDKPETAQRLFY